MSAAAGDAARLVEYTALFKNALVYSVVMANVQVIMAGHEGSVSLLVLCFIVASSIAFKLDAAAHRWAATAPTQLHAAGAALACFVTAMASNVSVQYTSQLVAEMATASLRSATVNWALYGALISFVFVYIMQRVAGSATVPCVQSVAEALAAKAPQ